MDADRGTPRHATRSVRDEKQVLRNTVGRNTSRGEKALLIIWLNIFAGLFSFSYLFAQFPLSSSLVLHFVLFPLPSPHLLSFALFPFVRRRIRSLVPGASLPSPSASVPLA